MKRNFPRCIVHACLGLLVMCAVGTPAAQADSSPSVVVTGELRQWHKVTVQLQGPFCRELDSQPNPFTDLCFEVEFIHRPSGRSFRVPGYFAADGNAAETGSQEGRVWRAHFAPDQEGMWEYHTSFHQGPRVALEGGGTVMKPFHGLKGTFTVEPTNKTGADFRAHGRLAYVGKHHLQFLGSGTYFLKAGPDAPETLLAYSDFDNTQAGNSKKAPLKDWSPHLRDWRPGDPQWQGEKGRSLIGALNYLASKEMNTVSFLPYNAGGDGDNVWPFVARDDKFHYDCSKLDQWGVVFDHAGSKGIHLHFKLQETEMDDNRKGKGNGGVKESLDGGTLGPERRLYCRELVARFGHALALNWNLGEENTQTTAEQKDMAAYLRKLDPYDHPVVLHTYPNQQEKVYTPLLGDTEALTGVSLQNPWNAVHERTLHWVQASAAAGHPWVVANDEQNPAGLGVPPDPGFEGFSGVAGEKGKGGYTIDEIRIHTLWGNLMAGGAGVEYYFGYSLPQNDLLCQDFRSRDQSWDFCRVALRFFLGQQIPFQDMKNADALVDDSDPKTVRTCLALPGDLYVVQAFPSESLTLDLSGQPGDFSVQWFNPRAGGDVAEGSVGRITGGQRVSLGLPPQDPEADWVALIRRR